MLAKRQDIENLQATLQSVMTSAGNKRTIDVDELRQKIVDGVKGIKGTSGKYSNNDVS